MHSLANYRECNDKIQPSYPPLITQFFSQKLMQVQTFNLLTLLVWNGVSYFTNLLMRGNMVMQHLNCMTSYCGKIQKYQDNEKYYKVLNILLAQNNLGLESNDKKISLGIEKLEKQVNQNQAYKKLMNQFKIQQKKQLLQDSQEDQEQTKPKKTLKIYFFLKSWQNPQQPSLCQIQYNGSQKWNCRYCQKSQIDNVLGKFNDLTLQKDSVRAQQQEKATERYIQLLRDEKVSSQQFFKKLTMVIPQSNYQKANKIRQIQIPLRYQKNNQGQQIQKMVLNQKNQLKDIYQLCSDLALEQKKLIIQNFIKDQKECCKSKLQAYKCFDNQDLQEILQINKQQIQIQLKKKINQIKTSETDNIETRFLKFKEAMNNNYNEIKLINGFIWYIYRSKKFGLSMQKRLQLLYDFVQSQYYLKIKQYQKQQNEKNIDQIKDFAKLHIQYRILKGIQSDFLTFTQFYEYETIKSHTQLRQSLQNLIKDKGKNKNLLNTIKIYFQKQNHMHHEYFFIKEKVFNSQLPQSYDNIKRSFLKIKFKDLFNQINQIKLQKKYKKQKVVYTKVTVKQTLSYQLSRLIQQEQMPQLKKDFPKLKQIKQSIEQLITRLFQQLQKMSKLKKDFPNLMLIQQSNQKLIIVLNIKKGENYIEQILVNSFCQLINIYLSSIKGFNMQIKWIYNQTPNQNNQKTTDL